MARRGDGIYQRGRTSVRPLPASLPSGVYVHPVLDHAEPDRAKGTLIHELALGIENVHDARIVARTPEKSGAPDGVSDHRPEPGGLDTVILSHAIDLDHMLPFRFLHGNLLHGNRSRSARSTFHGHGESEPMIAAIYARKSTDQGRRYDV